MKNKIWIYLPAITLVSLFSLAAQADDAVGPGTGSDGNYIITEKDKKFSPDTLTIPAKQKVKVTVKNNDSTPAEFESSDFDVEKVVSANSDAVVYIGPLDPGTYGYYDDMHEDSKGTIIAK